MEREFTRRRLLTGAGAVGAASLFGTQVTAALDQGQTDRHVVGVEPGEAGVARRGADQVYRELDFGQLGQAVAGSFSDAALQALVNNPNVRYVEVDGEMEAISQTLPWGVDRVDADVTHANGETGGDDTDGEGGADIAIIDTGIDSDHPDLQANLGTGKAFVEARGPYAEPWDDDNDHGTHCAGITDAIDNTEGVVGVSTAATLHAVKVLDKNGSGSYSDVAAGIEWTADQGHDVGSLSLGGGKSSVVEDAVEYAYGKGVLIVAAAGNDGPCSDCVSYPAAEPEVIAVSATSEDDSLAGFSSTGPEIELAAPGEGIYSTVIGSYDTFSGTSMACPHVSGAGGQLMDNGYTNTEARDQLNSTAEDIGLGSNEQGNGLLDVAAALGFDSSDDLGGDDNAAPTVDSLSASEVETDDSDAEFDADWAVSDADGNLESVDLTLTDDTDGGTEDTASVSVSGDTASGTTRLVAAGDDGSGNSYTVEAVVADTDGATDSDATTVTESEDDSSGDGSAPTIDQFGLTDSSNPRWARVEVDWAVSDADGDLASVTSEAAFADGDTDSEFSSVSGSSASGTHELRDRDGHGDADVTMTVTDNAGNTTSDTKTINLG
jgi:subtilisin